MHSTTLNINNELFYRFRHVSTIYNIPLSALVKLFLKIIYTNIDCAVEGAGLTRYQERTPLKNWSCFHIEFSETECRDNFNIRCRCRISLSRLLFVGALMFFDEVVEFLSRKNEKEAIQYYSYTDLKIKFAKLLYSEIFIFKKSEINFRRRKT